MSRKPAPKWSVDDVIQLFNDLPAGERRMTKRDLYRLVSGWRDPEHFAWLFGVLVAPLPGMQHKFVAAPDSSDRQRIWIMMVDRGY